MNNLRVLHLDYTHLLRCYFVLFFSGRVVGKVKTENTSSYITERGLMFRKCNIFCCGEWVLLLSLYGHVAIG